jgi:hypothetical protein
MQVTAAVGLALAEPDNHHCELLDEIFFERREHNTNCGALETE